MGWMSEYGIRLEFDADGIAICKESGDKYQLLNQTVKKIENA
jgi:UDP-2-acetamido-3-amino-2,3-dideoxy-glucuronate N-acetyltransferase